MSHVSYDPALVPPGAPARHDLLTQSIHWLSLAAVAIAVVAGLVMEEMPRGDAKTQLVNLHASFGVLVLALTAVRLGWRVVAPTPDPLPGSPLMQFAARVMHLALYAVLVAIPVSGVLMMAAKGRAFDVFGLVTVPPLTAPDRTLGKTLEELHEVLANSMLALVGLHAAAAIWHQLVLRDGALSRMLPGRAGR